MTYELHALISNHSALESRCRSLGKAKIILLNHLNLAFVPITSELQSELEAKGGRILSSSRSSIFERLTPAIEDWITSFSSNSAVAYVEAEFFGGTGGQCAVVWNNGEIILGPLLTRCGQPDAPLNVVSVKEMAINKALRLLGVQASGQNDEFDVAGLGRCRHTKKW